MTTLRRLSVLAMSLSVVALVGCGFSTTSAPVAGGTSARISGKVFGGQQPVLGSTVSVVEVGTTGYGSASTVLATTVSSLVDGTFNFPAGTYTCPFLNTPVYILAQGGDTGAGPNTSLALAAGLGACSTAQSQQVNINEVTTVATAFALGQFFTTTLGATDDFGANSPSTGTYSQGLVYANTYTIPTLVNLPYGTVNPSTSAITIEAAKIYSIANTLAACVNSAGGTAGVDSPCEILFTNTTPPGGATAPTDTLQAAVQMSLYPYQNVTTLFELASATAPFAGPSTAPNDFTIGVSYTTPAMGLGVSGVYAAAGTSSNIDIDSEGRVWFPSNLNTAPGIGYFDPTSNAFNGPYNAGEYLTQPQYVAIDLDGYVWATDQASGFAIGQPQDDPGDDGDLVGYIITANSGSPVSGGPIVINQDNSTFFEDVATDGSFGPELFQGSGDYSTIDDVSTFTYTPTGLNASYDGESTSDYLLLAATNGISTSCNLEFQYDSGTGFENEVAVSSALSPCTSGGVASTYFDNDVVSTATTANQLCSLFDGDCFAPAVPLNQPEGIATDGLGSVWVANSADGSISTLYGFGYNGDGNDYAESSPIEYLHNSTNGGTLSTPYGIAIDGSGNVWVSNASCVTTSTTACTPTAFVLSELIGAAAPAITPLAAQLSGTEAGTEPELKRRGLTHHVSPLLESIPAERKATHPQGATGTRIGNKS